MPISGRLQWAKKKCCRTHFSAQAAAAIPPRDRAKASTYEQVHTHTHTCANTHPLWCECTAGWSAFLQGPTELGLYTLWGDVPGQDLWPVTASLRGIGHTRSFPSTQTQHTFKLPPHPPKIALTQIQSDATCLSGQAPIVPVWLNSSPDPPPSFTLSWDIQLSKTGIGTFGRADSTAGLFGAFSFPAAGECYQHGSG